MGKPLLAALAFGMSVGAARMGAGCVFVPPPDRTPVVEARDGWLPEPGTAVVIAEVGADVGSDATGVSDTKTDASRANFIGQACVVQAAEPTPARRGFLQAQLRCGDQLTWFAAVRLRRQTSLAEARRLPRGLVVKISDIGEGDVYYSERQRFIGVACKTVDLARAREEYYHGTLNCFGTAYRFAYVALVAGP